MLAVTSTVGILFVLAGCIRFSSHAIAVTVPPMTSSSSSSGDFDIEFYVIEEMSSGSVIGSVADFKAVPRRSNSYRFLTSSSSDGRLTSSAVADMSAMFSIDETTGEIRTVERIDRERFCSRARNCVSRLDVVVQHSVGSPSSSAGRRLMEIVRVSIHVVDINDNAPSFPVSIVARSIAESAGIGSAGFLVPGADDLDGPPNGIIKYFVVDSGRPASSSPFNISSVSGGSTGGPNEGPGYQLRLSPTEHLDRETIDSYQLTIFAVDGGDQSLSGTMLVVVTVLDVNDHSPTFSEVAFETRVPEDADPGTVVFRASASDSDLGSNARLRYDFTDETSAVNGAAFGIRPETGAVYTRRRLDYETQRDYTLYVTASDRADVDSGGDSASLTAMTSVVVRVVDVNDNPPEIRFNFRRRATVTDDYDHEPEDDGVVVRRHPIYVDADAAVGTFVAHVTVRDGDSGDNGRFRCVLTSSVSTSSQARVIIAEAENEAVRRRFKFTLRQLYATEFVILTADRLRDDDVTGSKSSFDGAISKRHDRHVLTVYCADNGHPQLTAESSIVVTINGDHNVSADEENNKVNAFPVRRKIIVFRDLAAGTQVFCTRAFIGDSIIAESTTKFRLVDVDASSETSRKGYSLSGTTFLKIDSDTGIVSSRTRFDGQGGETAAPCRIEVNIDFDYVTTRSRSRRKSSFHRLRLVVFIITEPSSTTQERLMIISNKQDTYVGHEYSLASRWTSFVVAENSPSGTLVGTVPDSDSGALCLSGRDITFVVRSVPEVENGMRPPFNFDPKTGSLSTTEKLDGEKQREYNLAVFAQLPDVELENGCDINVSRSTSSLAMVGRTKKGSGLSDSNEKENGPTDDRKRYLVSLLRVQVDDANDNPPSIEFPLTTGQEETVAPVPCDAQIGHVVARVIAHDPDVGENAKLVYRIQRTTEPEANKFGMDFSTGVLYVSSSLDCHQYHQGRSLEIVVNVSDSGRPPLSTTAALYVSFVDRRRAGLGVKAEHGRRPFATSPETRISEHVFHSVLSSDTLATVLASVFGVLLTTILVIFGLVVWRRRRCVVSRMSDQSLSSAPRHMKSRGSVELPDDTLFCGSRCCGCQRRTSPGNRMTAELQVKDVQQKNNVTSLDDICHRSVDISHHSRRETSIVTSNIRHHQASPPPRPVVAFVRTEPPTEIDPRCGFNRPPLHHQTVAVARAALVEDSSRRLSPINQGTFSQSTLSHSARQLHQSTVCVCRVRLARNGNRTLEQTRFTTEFFGTWSSRGHINSRTYELPKFPGDNTPDPFAGGGSTPDVRCKHTLWQCTSPRDRSSKQFGPPWRNTRLRSDNNVSGVQRSPMSGRSLLKVSDWPKLNDENDVSDDSGVDHFRSVRLPSPYFVERRENTEVEPSRSPDWRGAADFSRKTLNHCGIVNRLHCSSTLTGPRRSRDTGSPTTQINSGFHVADNVEWTSSSRETSYRSWTSSGDLDQLPDAETDRRPVQQPRMKQYKVTSMHTLSDHHR